jgi:GAF domain-containing protein/HAMP domain-containing protein
MSLDEGRDVKEVRATTVAAAKGLDLLVRSMLGAGTIRTRLLISFVGLVLLPVLMVGGGMAIRGLRGDRQQVINQLESVAILKQAEIETWIDDLYSDLALALAGDEATRRALVLLEGPEDPSTAALAEGVVRTRFDQTIAETGRYQELFLVNRDGRVVVSTDRLQEGEARGSQVYFRQGLEGEALQPPRYSPTTMSTSVFVTQPVVNYQGEVCGVVVGRANLDRLTEIMIERAGLGETGETYLVDETHTLLTPSRTGRLYVGVFSEGIDAAADEKATGAGLYRNNQDVAVVGAYRWLPDLQVALIAEQEQAEAFRDTVATLGLLGVVTLISVALAVGAALLITRSIAAPLASLAQSATHIAAGELRRVAEESRFQGRDDEVGMLARAFYSMTDQLRGLIGGLEDRVAERTHELERRSTYLEAAARVSRAVSLILDVDVLIQQVVEVIREEFNLYYVGLFLVDDAAVLRAATGEGGKAMLERGHRLRVGEESMIGSAVAHGEARVAHGEARVAQQAGEGPGSGGPSTAWGLRHATPELPETRSEVALPLRSRGQIVGALSVQHREPGAFDQDSLVVLQTMADQVAVALDNAQLFAGRQQALDMAQRAYGELSREAWAEILHARTELGFLSDQHGVAPVGARSPHPLRAEAEKALQLGQTMSGPGDELDGAHVLAVPIRVRGQVIGVIDTYKPAEAGEWTAEEIALLERIAAELDPALESARLYQDTQRRAARERAIRHVTDRMRRSVEIEAILESTIVELAQALGVPRAYIRLGDEV